MLLMRFCFFFKDNVVCSIDKQKRWRKKISLILIHTQTEAPTFM